MRRAFEVLSPSRQQVHVTAVESAKAAEMRARRVASIVQSLGT